jgi:DNA-binding IclR family transcriptional regulator
LPAPPSVLDAAGLDRAEERVLTALWEADGASEASLARRARVPTDAVARLVESLGLLGYVEREAEEVWLTGDGFRLRSRAALRRWRATRGGRQPDGR